MVIDKQLREILIVIDSCASWIPKILMDHLVLNLFYSKKVVHECIQISLERGLICLTEELRVAITNQGRDYINESQT